MKRRHFLQQLTLVAGGLITASYAPVNASLLAGKKIRGTVSSNGKGIKNVVVSDGYSVVETDKKGRYEFDANALSKAVFVSTPAGYAFAHESYVSRHYHHTNGDEGTFNFSLNKLDKNDNEHHFIIWADPQIKHAKDVEKMMNHSVPDVKKWASEMEGKLLHGITVGDIAWDELEMFDEYSKAVGKMGIPFFQCLGNHDMDYRKGGDETSDDTFQNVYGPTYYSFNRGEVHYVVMDNVRYLGKEREYDGFFQQNQLDWLKKDLALVPKDKLIVLGVHIPVHNGVKNRDALYAILEDRNVHIMSGHTHYHRNVITKNIYEHNHGTVCGAWWTGPICSDGTPCGYGVYRAKGNKLSWQYKATGEDADHQMKVYTSTQDPNTIKVEVNIWNHDPEWKTEYWVDGVAKGALTQATAFDPLAYQTLLGPELPKPRGFAEPRKTEHMFHAQIPSHSKELKIEVTDRFGKKYTEIKAIG